MADPLEAIAEDVTGLPKPPSEWIRFCKVTSISAGVSATIDYGGTPITIVKAKMYCGAFPAANQWVAVGINGGDRFILGARLP
jgi:hypothetical protein